ncbi:MAG TPA: hypothetical protein VLE53_01945 [Gemmatimonadaceae bacterium]|nr:hypothetical protein [Gemmatimonadaceae bacterium]
MDRERPGATPDITIRDLSTLEDYQACVALQEATWGVGFSERVPAAILRVAQKVGGVSAGAFDAAGDMAGFVFGITGVRDGELVHWSDMLAVRRDLRGRHIGERLKQYQREKVRALGVRSMLWTFDPLMAPNAHFNFNRLGARPVEYVPDMYGSNTGSTLHGTLPTDRFIMRWELHAAREGPAGEDTSHTEREAPLANPLAADGMPGTSFGLQAPMEPAYRVQIPDDFGAISATGPHQARRWRESVRHAVITLLSHGYRVDAFRRATPGRLPYYTLVHQDSDHR